MSQILIWNYQIMNMKWRSMRNNIFEFWIERQQSYPLMSGFAFEVAMPTSTGSVQRIFSASGFPTLGRRNRLQAIA